MFTIGTRTFERDREGRSVFRDEASGSREMFLAADSVSKNIHRTLLQGRKSYQGLDAQGVPTMKEVTVHIVITGEVETDDTIRAAQVAAMHRVHEDLIAVTHQANTTLATVRDRIISGLDLVSESAAVAQITGYPTT